jgi:hypothetical protein
MIPAGVQLMSIQASDTIEANADFIGGFDGSPHRCHPAG